MSTKNLDAMLRRTARLVTRVETLGAIAAVVTVLLVAALAAVVLDAALALTTWALVGVDCVLAVTVLAALVYLAWVRRCNRYNPRRTARLIETRLGLESNQLINAVDLSGQDPSRVSPSLLAASVADGDVLAADVSPAGVVDSSRVKKNTLTAGGAAVVALVAMLVAPDMFRTVAARYLHPVADNPPFTLVTFDVTVEPEQIYATRRATIAVTVSSAVELDEQANVVFVDDQAGPSTPVPMLRSGPGKFVLNIERAERSRRFFIQTPDGRSKTHEMTVLPVPTFKRVRVTYDYPSYTRWPQGGQTLGPNYDIRAIADTTVTITVTSNQPLAGGRMTIVDPAKNAQVREVTLSPTSDPAVVSATFTLAASGRYALGVVNPAGVEGAMSLRGAMVCAQDQLPDVRIVAPARTVVASENWKIPLAIAARDDVGVRRIVLYRGVNSWPPSAIELPITPTGAPPEDNLTYAVGKYEFDLAALGVAPGDVITYYASAWDMHPRADHFADTPRQVIRVVSTEEYLQHARMTYQIKEMQKEVDDYRRALAEIDRRRRELIDELEKIKKRADKDGALSEADRERLKQIVAKQAEYARKMRELDQELKRRIEQMMIYDFEESYIAALAELARGLAKRAEQNEGLVNIYNEKKQAGLTDIEAKAYVNQSLEQLRGSEQTAAKADEKAKLTREQLDLLRQADELVALTERIVAIADQQNELARRLGEFSNTERLSPTEQIRARRMAGEQTQLRDELEKTLKAIESKAAAARDKLPTMAESADKLIAGVRDLSVTRDQEDAARLAQAGQGRYASRAAYAAADKLNSLIGECGGGGGMMNQAGQDLDRKLSLARQKIASSLLQLSQGRGIPGQNPGHGKGKGQGKGAGGYYGSRAKLTLVGPHGGGEGKGGLADALRGAAGLAPKRGNPRDGHAAESLSPDHTPQRMRDGDGRSMPGVPMRYRGLVEQYFRRLADESK